MEHLKILGMVMVAIILCFPLIGASLALTERIYNWLSERD